MSSELLAIGSTVWTQGPHIPGYGVSDSCAAKLSDTDFVILGGDFNVDPMVSRMDDCLHLLYSWSLYTNHFSFPDNSDQILGG